MATKQTPKEENKKSETKKQSQPEAQTAPVDNIAQPDKNAEDSQDYIRENAKKGESVAVPNVIGPNPVNVNTEEK